MRAERISSDILQTVFFRDGLQFFIAAAVKEQAHPPVKAVHAVALRHGFRPTAQAATVFPSAGLAFWQPFLQLSAGAVHLIHDIFSSV